MSQQEMIKDGIKITLMAEETNEDLLLTFVLENLSNVEKTIEFPNSQVMKSFCIMSDELFAYYKWIDQPMGAYDSIVEYQMKPREILQNIEKFKKIKKREENLEIIIRFQWTDFKIILD